MSRSASHDVNAATRAGLPSAADAVRAGFGLRHRVRTDPESCSESGVLDPGGGFEQEPGAAGDAARVARGSPRRRSGRSQG